MFKTNFATEMFTICRVRNQNQTIKNCPKMLQVTTLTLRKPSLLFQSVSFEAISMNGE